MSSLKTSGLSAVIAPSLLLFAPLAKAQRDMSVGLQSTMRSSGPSIRYPISEELVVQGVLGSLGTITSAAARGLLYFQDTEALDFYYYGQLGFWRYSGRFVENDSGIGIGIGAGLDYNLKEAAPDFLPITLSAEVGMGYVAWDDYSGFDLFTLGLGVHYRFGE